jgi:hypothetical protein
LVIKTEQKDFTLRLRGGKHASMEEVFIHQLKKAMQLAKAAAEGSQASISYNMSHRIASFLTKFFF